MPDLVSYATSLAGEEVAFTAKQGACRGSQGYAEPRNMIALRKQRSVAVRLYGRLVGLPVAHSGVL